MALVRRAPSGPARTGAPHPTNPDAAFEDLEHGNADQRRHAARDLASCPGTSARLCRRLVREHTPVVRETILTSLMVHDSDEAVRGLLPLLRSEDTPLRNGVLEALARMPTQVAPYVANLLVDADPDVRMMAIDLLAVARRHDTVALLLDVVTTESLVNICGAAVTLLAELGTPDVIPAIDAVARRFPHDTYLKFVATAAVQQITAAQTHGRQGDR